MKYFYLCLILLLTACSPTPSALSVIARAIDVHGGAHVKRMKLQFMFRGQAFQAFHDGSDFRYERTRMVDSIPVIDAIDNNGTYRWMNGVWSPVEDSLRNAVHGSINSVMYFALLPFKLADPAVRADHLGVVEMNGRDHHKIRVRFAKEGGGVDHDDVYVYWFDVETGRLAYLAYEYHVNGGGFRFREVTRYHEDQQVILMDYSNAKPTVPVSDVVDMDALWKAGKLTVVSQVNLERIQIQSGT